MPKLLWPSGCLFHWWSLGLHFPECISPVLPNYLSLFVVVDFFFANIHSYRAAGERLNYFTIDIYICIYMHTHIYIQCRYIYIDIDIVAAHRKLQVWNCAELVSVVWKITFFFCKVQIENWLETRLICVKWLPPLPQRKMKTQRTLSSHFGSRNKFREIHVFIE